MALQSYEEVRNYLVKQNRPTHLLLGNGFSMAYDPEIFSYNALYNFLTNLDDELTSKLFEIVKTKNFELVMQQLDNFCELIEAFGSDVALLEKVKAASQGLKASLIDAVKELHPEHVFKVSEEESSKCAEFLSTFLENGGNVFTTNYDILLYWVLLRNNVNNHFDGFGRDKEDHIEDNDSEPEYSELRWGKYKTEQNVHYVHGALPIFDVGIDIVKEEYEVGSYILDNIKKRIEASEYPVFVAAGNGDEKLNHILHNQYLSHCYEALSNIEGSLVTFGFNFGESDRHIIEAINAAAKNGRRQFPKLLSVYIGVYSEEDQKHIEGIRHLFQCKVNLFDAKTASVWR